MSDDTKVDELEGQCPRCGVMVKVRADGNLLVAAEHSFIRREGRKHQSVSCDRTDGHAVLAGVLSEFRHEETRRAAVCDGLRERLTLAESRHAEAVAARVAYAAKVAALTGVAPATKPAGDP